MASRCFQKDTPNANLREAVSRIVKQTPVTDIHTHIYSEAFGSLLLWGIDELLTYHYLIAEVTRATHIPLDRLWAMQKQDQADFIWHELFIERSPVSEACRGVLTVLDQLGLDTSSRDLRAYREFFQSHSVEEHIDNVFTTANVESVVMTNDPFDPVEYPVWMTEFSRDARFHAALRIDALLNDWTNNYSKLAQWGYKVEPTLNMQSTAEVRRFLSEWLDRTKALYIAASLPPNFAFPEESPRGELIAECLLPVAAERNIPFAMMVGVKKLINPALRLAGDGVGLSDVDSIMRLCQRFPKNKFMVTMLARENQHELCVLARKFRNLCLFGCWWFLNNPSLIEEMTRMRLELLGLSVVPQHSDARILDQLVYKWDHSRKIIANVLTDKYQDLLDTGWTLTEAEIERDAARLLGGAFWDFLQ